MCELGIKSRFHYRELYVGGHGFDVGGQFLCQLGKGKSGFLIALEHLSYDVKDTERVFILDDVKACLKFSVVNVLVSICVHVHGRL